MTGRLPDFLLIGAMKSGTTSLYEHLVADGRFFLTSPKEPGFFSREHVWARGVDWYRSLFANARDDQVCGEASTCYTRWPHFGDVVGRIAGVVPEVRLIYIMRDPVERAYSHYKHLLEHERRDEVIGFEKMLESEPAIIDAGKYAEQIGRFADRFDRSRILLLLMDDLLNDLDATLASVRKFLGVDERVESAVAPIHANVGGGPRFVRKRIRRRLRRIRNTAGIRWLVDRLPVSLRETGMRSLTDAVLASPVGMGETRKHKARLEPMSDAMRDRLLEIYREPNRDLSALLGRDLSAWGRSRS